MRDPDNNIHIVLYARYIAETEILGRFLKDNEQEPIITTIQNLNNMNLTPQDTVITTMFSKTHPKKGVTVYRIDYNNKSVVYATDKESYVGGDKALSNFARNTDLLIHDTQYTDCDYNSIPKFSATPFIDGMDEENANFLIGWSRVGSTFGVPILYTKLVKAEIFVAAENSAAKFSNGRRSYRSRKFFRQGVCVLVTPSAARGDAEI